MPEQARLRSVQRRERLLWRARHGEMGAIVQELPHHLAGRSPAQPLPLLRPGNSGGMVWSDAHTCEAARKMPIGHIEGAGVLEPAWVLPRRKDAGPRATAIRFRRTASERGPSGKCCRTDPE